MTPVDKTAPSQRESIAFDFDLQHSPATVWRALTEPGLLAEWLLPVLDLRLEPGAQFTLQAVGPEIAISCQLAAISYSDVRVGGRSWRRSRYVEVDDNSG